MAVEELQNVQVEDISGLTDDELLYLLQRSRHVKEVEAELNERGLMHTVGVNHDPVFQLSKAPNFGDANTKMADPPRTREEGEEDESYLDEMKVREENLTKPQLVGAGVEDDDDDDDFEIPEDTDYESDAWNNDKRRAELQRRAEAYDDVEVDLGANKAGLIEQLQQLDADNKR